MVNQEKHIIEPGGFFFLIWQIFIASRPLHWTKNLSLFAALVFSGNLFLENYFLRVIFAFVAFSLASYATYIFNDLLDTDADRVHPIKKERPIAKGFLPISLAGVSIAVFVLIALYIASLLNTLFFLAVIAYLSLQATYSLGLKNLATVDIL